MKYFVGLDVGSLTTKLVLIDIAGEVLYSDYRRNEDGPIEAIQAAFRRFGKNGLTVGQAGTTGSGRHLAAVIIGAGTVVNEITAHALAARRVVPAVRTVIDIGGQDSKIIYLQEGMPVGFNMNTVCAAGTGSFLDHQAARLNIPIEKFGDYALRSRAPVAIAGRCGVFAESDLIHKQQLGYRREDLIAGLCLSLAKNYLANVARNRKIEPPVLFQGGVAANAGLHRALEQTLGVELQVPPHFRVMGAFGAALLAREQYREEGRPTGREFRGAAQIGSCSCHSRGFTCNGCANFCEISELIIEGEPAGRWGSRCGKWDGIATSATGV